MTSPHARVRWPTWARWLHTYVSLIGFATILFFSVTGLTLNHAGFFESGGDAARDVEGTLPAAPLAGLAASDPIAAAAWMRGENKLHGELASFASEANAYTLIWKAPGYACDAVVERATGKYTLSERRQNWIAVLDDLHKGRDSGAVWSFVIDASAVLMAVAALTGLWLLVYVRSRRAAGYVVAGVGLIVIFAASWLFVP